MQTSVLIERQGKREQVYVKSEATRIEGIQRIKWIGSRPINYGDYYSLVHVLTGRAINRKPLTETNCDRLVHALKDSSVEFDQVFDVHTAHRFFVDRLTYEARELIGVKS